MRTEDLSLEERFKRDGERWRYIYLLEVELERRKTRRIALMGSLIMNVILLTVVVGAWLF